MLRILSYLLLVFFSASSFAQAKIGKALVDSIFAGMIPVDGGTFSMGCTAEQGQDCYYWEKPDHYVLVGSFYIGRYDVTQAQWAAVMDSNPSFHKHCPDCPVDNVSWQDALDFIAKLNRISGKKYRLPTEAEWEYAARGGAASRGYKYPGGNDIDALAWYDANSGDTTHRVGLKRPNELGLYDMAGNVWQWCSDWFDLKYYASLPADQPKGPDSGKLRVIRGGSWNNYARVCRMSYRNGTAPDKRFSNDGFRLAMDR